MFASSAAASPERYASDQIAVLKSPQLAAAAAAAAAKGSPPLTLTASDFSAHTVVSGTPLNGSVVQIAFTASDEATAFVGVDAIKTAYEKTVRSGVGVQLSDLLTQIDNELSTISGQLANLAVQRAAAPADNSLVLQENALLARRDALSTKRDQVVVDASSGSNGVSLYLPPQGSTHSSKLVAGLPVIAVAALVGLVVSMLIAYVLASRRRIVRSRDEPELVLGVPLIADVPPLDRAHPLPTAAGGRARPGATAFRQAALFIEARQLSGSGRRETPVRTRPTAPRRLLVVSAGHREGRSAVATNLGLALVNSGLSTLLVDADPVTPALSRTIGERFQLEPVVERNGEVGGGAPAEFVLSNPTHGDGLIGAGFSMNNVVRPGHSLVRLAVLEVGQPPHVLEDEQRDQGLHDLEAAFSVVVIDGPPLRAAGPYWPLLRRADEALVVVAHGSSIAQLEDLANLLKAVGMAPFGYMYTHPRRQGRLLRRDTRTSSAPPSRRSLNVSA